MQAVQRQIAKDLNVQPPFKDDDALEAEVTAPAYEEAGFNEEELNGDSGHDDDRDE